MSFDMEADEDYFPSEDFDAFSSFSCSSPGYDQYEPPSPPPIISTSYSFPPALYVQSVFSQSSLDQYVQPANSSLPLPAFTPTPSWDLTQDSLSTPNPNLPFDDDPPHQVTVDDPEPPPFSTQSSEESADQEGSIRFGQRPVRRPPERSRQLGHRSVIPLGPTNRRPNVGPPSSTTWGGEGRGGHGMMQWMTRLRAKQALTVVAIIIIVVTGVAVHFLAN